MQKNGYLFKIEVDDYLKIFFYYRFHSYSLQWWTTKKYALKLATKTQFLCHADKLCIKTEYQFL